MSGPIFLQSACGATIPLPVRRWRAEASAGERRLLTGLEGPVLDIGCGPGRLVGALAEAGRPALGIDPSPTAVEEAAARGAPVLQRSVFGPLPAEGRWGSALLVDGNIGIGGDPVGLLRRVRDLLEPGGTAVVEVEPPGQASAILHVRVCRSGPIGPWFPWARVSSDHIAGLAIEARLDPGDLQRRRRRWFAWLKRP
jgi:SAM-dependent methyltransferase